MEQKTNQNLVARRMRSLYSACAYERKDLARSLGVTVQTVKQWESGEKTMDVNQLRTIASFLGMPCEWFFVEDEANGEEVSGAEKQWIANRLHLTPETVDDLETATAISSEVTQQAIDLAISVLSLIVRRIWLENYSFLMEMDDFRRLFEHFTADMKEEVKE